MTPLPEKPKVIILDGPLGPLRIATNIAPNVEVIITTSEREFNEISKGQTFKINDY